MVRLLRDAEKQIQQRNARTLTPQHIKQAIMSHQVIFVCIKNSALKNNGLIKWMTLSFLVHAFSGGSSRKHSWQLSTINKPRKSSVAKNHSQRRHRKYRSRKFIEVFRRQSKATIVRNQKLSFSFVFLFMMLRLKFRNMPPYPYSSGLTSGASLSPAYEEHVTPTKREKQEPLKQEYPDPKTLQWWKPPFLDFWKLFFLRQPALIRAHESTVWSTI